MKLVKSAALISVLFLGPFSMAMAQGTQVIRNGDFSNGLTDWNIDPGIDPTWSPLQEEAVDLNPPGGMWEGYTGAVLYQNLNVSDIAGKSFTFSMDLIKTSEAGDGKSMGVELVYVKDEGGPEYMEVQIPANDETSDDPLNPTNVEQDLTFPEDARKLIKMEIVKEGWGYFIGDNISLMTTEAVTTGDIPAITELSALEAGYGTQVTITGNHFGSDQGYVSIGGSSEGANIQSWSDSSIQLTVEDPARSGLVHVISDYVESDPRYSFRVTSPHYTVDLIQDDATVVKGQVAEFIIRADFHNDFDASGNISFSTDDQTLPAGATAEFSPASLSGEGGALLRIDTTGMSPGEYVIFFQAQEPSTQPRLMSLMLEVVTIDTIRFFDPDTDEDVTSVTLDRQGMFNDDYGSPLFDIQAVDSNGDVWTLFGPLGLGEGSPLSVSGDSEVVEVVTTNYYVDYYALAEGTGFVQVNAADGTSAQLPVTVAVPDGDPYVNVSLSPIRVHHNSTEEITFTAQSTHPLTGAGFSSTGQVDFRSTFLDNTNYFDENKQLTSTFQLGNEEDGEQEPGIFTALLYAGTSDGEKTATGYALLDIVPDPNLAQLKGGVRMLDDDVFAEYFVLEFYDNAGNKVHERELFMHHQRNFHLPGIPTGTYRLKFVYEVNGFERAQWYPNAGRFEDALPLEFTAGESVEDVYVFLKKEPSISFTGSVMASDPEEQLDDIPVENATVSMAGNWNLQAYTDSNGAFTLSGLPIGDPFALEITHNDYVTVYSETILSHEDIMSRWPFIMFTSQELGDQPLWQGGKGMVTGRVVDALNPDQTLQGVTVTYTSSLGNTDYDVVYFNGDSFTTTATAGNGLYFIFGVAPDDDLTVEARKDDWSFQGPSFHGIREDAVHEGMILGTFSGELPKPGLDQAIRALRIAAGQGPGIAGIRDVNQDGRIGSAEAVYVLQTQAELRDPLYPVESVSGSASLISRGWDADVPFDGFIFSSGSVADGESSDFIVEWNIIFTAPGVGVMDLGAMPLDQVAWVPRTGYSEDASVLPADLSGRTIAFKLAEGDYAVIRFTEFAVELEDGTLRSSFDYKYQPDGTPYF